VLGLPREQSQYAARTIRALVPTGGGLPDQEWRGRHRLLTWSMVASTVALTMIGLQRNRLDAEWFITVVLIACCTACALFLPPRRLPSSAVAFGFTVVCADLVAMCDGLTEAHFGFFIAIGALALYRDWVPFLTFLIGTVVHHAFAGALLPGMTYDHASAVQHPLQWAMLHGVAVLLCAGTQVIGWRLTETEERRSGDDLTKAEAQFTAAFEEAPIPMTMMAPDGQLLRVNPAFTAWLGLPEVLPPGYSSSDLPCRPEPANQPPMLDRLLASQVSSLREERTYRHDNGRFFHVDMHCNALRDDAGALQLVVTHFLDVTEKRAQEATLQRKIRQDALTKLLSRSAFEDDLAELIEARAGEVCVIYIDVDRFKAVNDSHGHGAGDEVLRALGSRLSGLTPDDGLLARLGGDEFAIALPGPIWRAEMLGDAIVRSCNATFQIARGPLTVTVSVGVSAAASGESAEGALHSADLAMYAAKQGGRDQIRMFDAGMRQDTQRRVLAEQSLRDALDGDRAKTLPVWFQPIVSLPSRSIVGAEALIRLRTVDGQVVPPADFIPIAEETGLVIPLGEHVLRTALARLQQWGNRLPYVSVNVSPRQLAEAGFVPMLTQELAISGLQDRSRLVLEITETSLLQNSLDLKERLDAIKELGVRMALDDFGTGYSSLTWLQSVPADIVKLDRSFVAGLASDSDKAAIISAVLWLAKALGMSVIAEGVEDEEDAQMLGLADCPAAQGYLFSRPVEPQALEALLPPGPAELAVQRQRSKPAASTDELLRSFPSISHVP
jgi:diguanylate cyclase (GGDEF)-like protein/PAS domain S-box-containing protein